MAQGLHFRKVVAFGFIFAVCLSCFGVDQQGAKRERTNATQDTGLVVQVSASLSLVKLPPKMADLTPLNCETTESEVRLYANSTSPHKSDITFTWEVPVGHLSGKGREVTWDLSGVQEGTYTATVQARDEKFKQGGNGSVTVTVVICPGWHPDPPPCPTVSVSCPSEVDPKEAITFEATVSGGDPEIKRTYQWSVSSGKIISGQGTSKISVDVSDLSDASVTGTVSIGGDDPLCQTDASCSVHVKE
jgi:hypothetical protein